MRYQKLAFLVAAALLAGTMHMTSVQAAEAQDDEAAVEEYDSGPRQWRGRGRNWRDRDDQRDHRGPGRGPGRHSRFDGPGCDFGPGCGYGQGGFHRGERGGPGHMRDDRGGPRHMRGERGPGHMGLGHGGRWMDLDLDDAQKTKLADVMTTNFRAGLEARMALNDARNKLEDLRDDENASSDAIIAANAAMGEAKGRLEALRRKSRDDFRAVLTPEQLKKLDERRGPAEDGRRGPPPSVRDGKRDGRPGPRK